MNFPEFKPADKQSELEAFYSKHILGPDGRPTAGWQSEHLTRIKPAYPLTLAFPPGSEVTRVLCHKKVADSLTNVFAAILAHFGSLAEVRKARMHLFGGCFNFRRITGGTRLSDHAWGIALDIDPDKNPFNKKHDPSKGMMPLAVVKIFEDAGWRWGGHFPKPDCMHFQATK